MRQKVFPASSPLVKRLDAQSNRRSFAFFYITNLCNLRCGHCSFQSGPDKKETHMSTPRVLDALDELTGIHDITITGGEPLLHPGFKQVLSRAAGNAGTVYLMTNGIELIGKERIRGFAKTEDMTGLKKGLKSAMESFPENLHLFFPLDSFHLKAFRPFSFLLKGLATLAHTWNGLPDRPFIGFICNETTREKSRELTARFDVAPHTHVGTALFSPWRKQKDIGDWYCSHELNRMPFPGGIYINYKGVYLNEAALLMDLRREIETPLKIGTLAPQSSKNSLERLYLKAVRKFF